MRIAILDSVDETEPPDPSYDVLAGLAPYLSGHRVELVELRKSDGVKRVRAAAKRFDVFINLCDGTIEDPEYPGVLVVRELERLGAAYTGGHPPFYEHDRQAMNRACGRAGLACPAAVQVRDESDIARALRELRFPLIVKHWDSYASIGLTPRSRVSTAAELGEQVALIVAEFGAARVEEFVEGREFTVLVGEDPRSQRNPYVYVPVEFRFPEGTTFKHYDIKWKDCALLTCVPCDDPELDARLRHAAKSLFLALGGVSYGRCDIRVDAAGTVWVLEMNSNCGLFYPPGDDSSADFILRYDPEGKQGFVNRIITAAQARANRRKSARLAAARRRERREAVGVGIAAEA